MRASSLTSRHVQIYHEATLTNLLEVAFYHEHVVESLEDDVVLELIDYCMRKVTWLIGLPRETIASATTFHKSGEEIVRMMQAQTPRKELARHHLEIEFRIAVQCVTLLRYIAERLHLLPLSVVARLMDKHDVLLSLVVLIENPPWTHKAVAVADGQSEVTWKKFVDQKWAVVEPSDLLSLTTTEAQVWLAVYYLLCTKSAREHYEVTQYRKDQLLRIRKYMNDILLDQLPLLADVQRYLDELSIVQVTTTSVMGMGSLVMEAVPYVRDAIVRRFRSEYAVIGARFDAMTTEMDRADDLKALAEVYQMDGIEDLLEGKLRTDGNTESVDNNNNNNGEGEGEEGAKEKEDERTLPASLVPALVNLRFDNSPDKRQGEVLTTRKPLIVEINDDDDDNNVEARQQAVEVACEVDQASRKEMKSRTHHYYRYLLRPAGESAKSSTISPSASVEAKVWFNDPKHCDGRSNVTLRCEDLQLPAASESKAKLWRQVGSLEQDSLVVVQCQLVPETMDNQQVDGRPGFRLGSLYLSVPF